ncbi:GAF domain-containing protein [Paraburkholderia fungorum]|uniref:GAF domain-containing protein n=1 Tax=Paraburkholderia fungorum TaxID=134537 RepID=UPI0038BB2B5D
MTFQTVIENLLVETGASRAILALFGSGETLNIDAEAVSGGAQQLRHDGSSGELFEATWLKQLERERSHLVQDDLDKAQLPTTRELVNRYGARSQVMAPIVHLDRLVGVIALHAAAPRRWTAGDLDAIDRAQTASLSVLQERDVRVLPTSLEQIRDAALQTILDSLREGLRVQRCTLRQNLNTAFVLPVTHESRGPGVRSLLGDLTIVQSGQPVIQKLLAERVQVVQDDTRNASPERVFQVMLEHYGDLRSQIVTPLFREDTVAGAISVHCLKELRAWTREEKELARSASRLIGLLIGATLA